MPPSSPVEHPSARLPVVALSGVSKTYESGTVALRGFDLSVRAGEFVSLLGPSGCGKSTALRIIAGLSEASAGSAVWPGGTGQTGFVFQEPTLMPWASVDANVRLPLTLARAEEATLKHRRNAGARTASGLRILPMPSRANCRAA